VRTHPYAVAWVALMTGAVLLAVLVINLSAH